MRLSDWSSIPQAGFQIDTRYLIGPKIGWSDYWKTNKLPLIRIFSKLDKNSKRNSMMVCRHWYDTVQGYFIRFFVVYRNSSLYMDGLERFISPVIPDKVISEPTLWSKYSLSVLDPSLCCGTSENSHHPARSLNNWSINPSITTYRPGFDITVYPLWPIWAVFRGFSLNHLGP